MSRACSNTGPEAIPLPIRIKKDSSYEKKAAITHKASSAPSKAYNILSDGLGFDKDSTFWWKTTAAYLALALEQASYAPHDQYEGLLFYYRYCLPYLGPRPTSSGQPKSFRSFVTDDHSPFELSWSWGGSKTASPTVRFLIEAIGPESGTASDPFNQKATLDLVAKLAAVKPDIDWSWFNHFWQTLLVTNSTPGAAKGSWNPFTKSLWNATSVSHFQQAGHSSSVFLAFDLQRGKLLVKPYFLPSIRAFHTGQTPLEVITEGVRSFEHAGMNIPALDNMLQFVHKHPELQLEFLAIAPDCVSPTQSRLKIYIRCPHTSWDSVHTIMTLGGRITGKWWDSSMTELKKLWWLVLGLDKEYPTNLNLPYKHHNTSGILYNIDIKPGSTMPEPKTYIPSKHYSKDDLGAAYGLCKFLNEQGRGAFTGNFLEVLEGMSTHRQLNEGSDIQTYIGCAFKKGSLDTSSYLSPAIYHAMRWKAPRSRVLSSAS